MINQYRTNSTNIVDILDNIDNFITKMEKVVNKYPHYSYEINLCKEELTTDTPQWYAELIIEDETESANNNIT